MRSRREVAIHWRKGYYANGRKWRQQCRKKPKRVTPPGQPLERCSSHPLELKSDAETFPLKYRDSYLGSRDNPGQLCFSTPSRKGARSCGARSCEKGSDALLANHVWRVKGLSEETLAVQKPESKAGGGRNTQKGHLKRVDNKSPSALRKEGGKKEGAAVNDPVGIPLRQVSGVLKRSVLLSVNNIPPSEKVTRVEWEFQPQTGIGLYIAEITDGKLERPDPKDRFGLRLEVVNETTLRIQNLEKEDSGLYRTRVRLHPAKMEEHAFQLTVFDPVPEPHILLLQEMSDSSSECNVTLRCLVSKKTGLNVSWRIGDGIEPLEGGLDWYQLSSEGWSLHLSNLSNPTDSRVTCLVYNPADRKSASMDLIGTCSLQGSQNCFSWVRITFAIGLVFEIAIVTFLNLLERKDRVQS